MKAVVIGLTLAAVIGAFSWLFTRKNLLSYFRGGQLWLTWLAVAVICMMDELTSIFYAPSEAFRFIGLQSVAFIAVTSLLMRFLSTRYVEIAQILEHHGIKGGGVYSFSYLVLGPTWSFVAIASILVTYILTACLSAVSAVENGMAFIHTAPWMGVALPLIIIWGIAFLNILGIQQNARFTFGVYFLVALVLLTMLATGLQASTGAQWKLIGGSFVDSAKNTWSGGLFGGFGFVTACIAACILAYSGIESVIQTAGLVRTWRDIRKAYLYRAVTIGLFTPLVAALVLTSGIDVKTHETDLITAYAASLNGRFFGVVVGLVACIALIMAVNTAFIATSELFERMAERYRFHWMMATNRWDSLWRMHLINAVLFSAVVVITQGSQKILAEMYALGLVASFTINFGSLLLYRFREGTREIREYHTNRVGTLGIFVILAGCFVYLAVTRAWGLGLWAVVTVAFVLAGLVVSKRKAIHAEQVQKADSPMLMVFSLAERPGKAVHVHFHQPRDRTVKTAKTGVQDLFISFFSARAHAPERLGENHWRFVQNPQGLPASITELLYTLDYELPDRKITVHFGWPMSSWLDRLGTITMVFGLMRLPRLFPRFDFAIDYKGVAPPKQA
ncbi:MAG: amino acid permease [Spirochaetes bacterium]|nr:amino acid permease [Spirochaetota bacterium]